MSAASTFIGPKVRKTFAAFLLLTALAGAAQPRMRPSFAFCW